MEVGYTISKILVLSVEIIIENIDDAICVNGRQ